MSPTNETSTDTWLTNQKASATKQAADLNAQLAAIYNRAFDNWKLSVEAARIPNTNPPTPPAGFAVAKSFDAPDSDIGYWDVVQTKDPVYPVCIARTDIPPDGFTVTPSKPMNIHVIRAVPDTNNHWFVCALDDTYPLGRSTPPMEWPGLDGSHIGLRVGAAVGPGWYEIVS